MLKRIFDLGLSSCGLMLVFPFLALFSLIIWLEDGRPIFYIQERVGRDARIFKLIKLRTMNSQNRDIPLFMRFLRKTALDELPQLMNILKGEMSFVGPRPLVPQELGEDEKTHLRLTIQPGLTGVAQICAPKNADREIKFDYDIWYGNNQSFKLDLKLIFASFRNTFGCSWDM